MKAKALMVVGTANQVGKSLIVTALCRLLSQQGRQVTPFQAQQTTLNTYVTADGREMAYEQAYQAWAAGILPDSRHNPILLKPQGSLTYQVILNGRVTGLSGPDPDPSVLERRWSTITGALDALGSQFEWIIAEGVGSPVETATSALDVTNLRVAAYLQAPTWLVADVDRGGAVAHILGTLALLPPDHRQWVQGIILNRGTVTPAQIDWLRALTSIPIIATLPNWDLTQPTGESLLHQSGTLSQDAAGGITEIAVIQLPRIANFTDYDALGAEPSVRLRFVRPGEWLGQPDVVIIPGTKATIPDLLALQATGLAQQIRDCRGVIVGLGGGLQLLGDWINDPEGLEGEAGHFSGLGLLPVTTVLESSKITRQIATVARWPQSLPIQGYELHQGRSTYGPGAQPLFEDDSLGVYSQGGRVWGCYVHGLFDNHTWRRLWLNQVRERQGLPPLPLMQGHFADQRQQWLDHLADRMRPYLDWGSLLS